jgi:alanine dehydrogenase
MKIGIPKEIKDNENRVAITPGGVQEFIANGHTVYVQKGAGVASGYNDSVFMAAGATLLPTIEEIYATADMIYKVKEPIEAEYDLVKPGQVIFAYFHFANEPELTQAMIRRKAVCIAFETVRGPDGHSLPLLTPMSEVAGRMAAQEGARFLERPQGGKGILLSGIPGVKPANVLILGAGTVGFFAALSCAGMGANVTIADISIQRLRQLRDILPHNVNTLYSTKYNIEKELPLADMVVGAALVPGAKTPHLITRDMLKLVRPGTVLIDVAIDQGGCFESSHPTTHKDPTFVVDGILHYCVANIPGAVPYTSTPGLANATFPYALRIANLGWRAALKADKGLRQGLNIVDGKIAFKVLSDQYNLPYEAIDWESE